MTDVSPTIELIDNAVRDWETSPDAMRWTPDPERDQSGRSVSTLALACDVELTDWQRAMLDALTAAPREPQVDAPCLGCQLVPFVGGPRHCDLAAVRLPLPSAVAALEPPLDCRLDPPGAVVLTQVYYTLRTIYRYRHPRTYRGQVYSAPWASDAELTEACSFALAHGWTLEEGAGG